MAKEKKVEYPLIDKAENRGMVPRERNLWDQVIMVNSRVLISKIDVFRGFWGPSASFSSLKSRFCVY